MTTTYKIHPAIGIARVGDSDEYYVAPSAPGALPTEYSAPGATTDRFRDAQGKLLKQAARFKVYRYDDQNPQGVEMEAGRDGLDSIEWTVWVCNKKSSWFQFKQQTGSGMGPYPTGVQIGDGASPYAFANDLGYDANNANNPYTSEGEPTYPDAPYNPLRYNKSLGTTPDPRSIDDEVRRQLVLDPGPKTLPGPGQREDFALDPARYSFLAGLVPFPVARLGTALTDGGGNLLILGGDGNSGTTSHDGEYVTIDAYANNEGWFDDIADGPVTAVLHMSDGSAAEVDASAWVVVAPPAYAPQIINQVNMYDNMFDVFVREFGASPAHYRNGAFDAGYEPSYPDEIAPILSRPALYQYVCNIPGAGLAAHDGFASGSGPDPEAFRSGVFGYVRGRGNQYPGQGADGPAENQPLLMPFLAGDNPISNETISKYLGLTRTQYFVLSQYANGRCTTASLPTVGPGVALDAAHLQNCVGGAFSPGIEITWITRNASIYKSLPPGFDASDFFRINTKPLASLRQYELSLSNGSNGDYSQGLEPGDLSKYMAQPWQADFNECSIQDISNLKTNEPRVAITNYWWWPAQRPYAVYPEDQPTQQVMWTRGFVQDIEPNPPGDPSTGNNCSDIQMVTCWKYLGFVVENDAAGQEPRYVETSRQTDKIEGYQSYCKAGTASGR